MCIVLRFADLFPLLLNEPLLTLFVPTDKAWLLYLGADLSVPTEESVPNMIDMITGMSSEYLGSHSLAGAAKDDNNGLVPATIDEDMEVNLGANGFNLTQVLLLHATLKNVTTEELRCNNQTITLLSGQNTTTECSTTAGNGNQLGKFQVGNGQPINRKPEITSEIRIANGFIQVVDNVIIPGDVPQPSQPSQSPSESPSVSPSESSTESPSESPTKQPITNLADISGDDSTDTEADSTDTPTKLATDPPTLAPTPEPTETPTKAPIIPITSQPTVEPTTSGPTTQPTVVLTVSPTSSPITPLTDFPTTFPPTNTPATDPPTTDPPTTDSPTTESPTKSPTDSPIASTENPAQDDDE